MTIKWRREKLITLHDDYVVGLEGDKSCFAMRDLQERWLEEDLRVNLAHGSNACYGVGVVGHARYVGKAMDMRVMHDVVAQGMCATITYLLHFQFHEYCNV